MPDPHSDAHDRGETLSVDDYEMEGITVWILGSESSPVRTFVHAMRSNSERPSVDDDRAWILHIGLVDESEAPYV